MIDWPRPTIITELCGFIGFIGYYRKFVENYGIVAKPLSKLLKKGMFKWDSAAEEAFTRLKHVMTSTPTLALPKFFEPFTVEANAYGEGIGAVLTQQGKLIAYMSRALGVSK